MTDKTQLHKESDRGAHARALLDNPLFQDAFMAINRKLWTQLNAVNVHDKDEITALLLMLKANRKLYEIFESHVKTGQMADITLTELRERGK